LPRLRILLATDLERELEPCGCTSGQLGGVDRLARVVTRERADGAPTLFVVAGNSFRAAAERVVAAAPAQQTWAADTLAELLGSLQVDAVGLGLDDLALGHARLAELAGKGAFQWLAAGVTLDRRIDREPATAELMATTPMQPLRVSTLLRKGDLNVGVVGLLEAPIAGFPRGSHGPDDALEAGIREVARLRSSQADLVIALAHGSSAFATRIAAAAKPDLIVQTGPDEAPAVRALEASTLVRAGHHAESITTLDLYANGAGPWRVGSPGSASSCSAVSAERCITVRQEKVDASTAGDAAARGLLDRLTQRIKTHNREAYADALPPTLAAGQAGYVGSRPCAACHTAEYVWWLASPHGKAFATLQQRDKDLDLECVGCHVTGYQKPGGSSVTHVAHLENVGCESCHGPGSQHVLDPRPPQKTVHLQVADRTCLECHDAKHDAGFDDDAYRAKLKASGHGRQQTGH
jgi:5-methylcytosine-specific restriction endonuclease McrA